MTSRRLAKDPYNIVITGVGGQGNVMASRVLANMLVRRGFKVTIGETFGMSQRGGSVMSHIRVSPTAVWSPQIPKGRADLIVAIEPLEAIRVLLDYGNPDGEGPGEHAADLPRGGDHRRVRLPVRGEDPGSGRRPLGEGALSRCDGGGARLGQSRSWETSS